jgi:hypothetical protein
MINRRTFLQNVAFVASAPALTNLFLISSTAQSPASESVATSKPQPPGKNAVFKIHGWDRQGGSESQDNQVWISINDSWRTAWR